MQQRRLPMPPGQPTALAPRAARAADEVVRSANVTVLQSWTNQSVDVVLALCLMVGSGVAAPLGAQIGRHLGAAEMRILMAILVLAVAVWLGYGLVATPVDIYSARDVG